MHKSKQKFKTASCSELELMVLMAVNVVQSNLRVEQMIEVDWSWLKFSLKLKFLSAWRGYELKIYKIHDIKVTILFPIEILA